MNYRDDFAVSFLKKDDFFRFLDEVEERAEWQVFPTESLITQTVEDFSGNANGLSEKMDEAEKILEDTRRNTGLLLEAGGNRYPVGTTAIKTLENRARISGYALSDLKKEKLSRILNDCLEVTKGQALFRICEGKVRAVHGGDKNDYSILPMPQIFEAAAAHIEETYENVRFLTGYFDHSVTTASWEVTDKRLLETYEELLLQYGQAAEEPLTASIQVHSSDVGTSGANIFCSLLMGKNRIPLLLGGAIKLPHKDNATVDQFCANVAQIFARYQEEIEGLSNLFRVYVNYPLNVIAGVMKKADIGVTLRAQTTEQFRVTRGAGRCSGYDVYCGICESIFLAQTNGMSPRLLIDLEEKVSKCLKMRFHEYDIPGNIRY